jgi:hypothetical protein
MARRSAAPGSRRRHGDVRRERRLTVWYSETELAAVRRAAGKMAPAAWLAKLGTDAARGGEAGGRVLASEVADLAAGMSEATEVARKNGYLFDQAVARLHTLGEHSADLEASAAVVARAVRRMEAATLKVARVLLR